MINEEFVKLVSMEIDPHVQRELNEGWVKKIMDGFDPDVIGHGIISRRDNGRLILLDGQHRRAALLRLLRERPDDKSIPDGLVCAVHEGLSVEDEARIFRGHNTFLTPTPMDKFKVDLEARKAAQVDIATIVEKWGWKIGFQGGDGYIAGIETVQKVYAYSNSIEADPNLLDIYLEVVTKAWGRQKPAAAVVLLDGLASLLGVYAAQHSINIDRLIKKLAEYPGGPTALVTNGRGIAKILGISSSMGISHLLVQTYNQNLPENRQLPTWQRRRSPVNYRYTTN